MTTPIPHDAITTPRDTVRCRLDAATLPAITCALRHVARDQSSAPTRRWSLRVLPAAAQYPLCAACDRGAVARERLGVRGSPGTVPRVPVEYGQQRVPTDRWPGPRAPLAHRRAQVVADDVPDAAPVVRHPRDAVALDRWPWGAS